MAGHDLVELAGTHGTPLHVASAATLRRRATELAEAFRGYPWPVRIHFSYKTNRVAGVLRVLHDEGLGAEVVDDHELWLARRLGVPAEQIVLNGPNKSAAEIQAAVDAGLGLLVVDGLQELDRVERAAAESDRMARIALRLCPDVIPRGVNASSLTGSRKNQFGMESGSPKLTEAIRRAVASPHLKLRGMMAHIGSGIRDMRAFSRQVSRLLEGQREAIRAGAEPDLLDIGGGLGTHLSREMSTPEMLLYLGTGRLPRRLKPAPTDLFARYGEAICHALVAGCRRLQIPLPQLVLEPGRALVSDSQVLLLSVGTTRDRPGVGRFALTDGGAMTVSMMFLSELHGVFLASRDAPVRGRTSVFGRLPSPMDVVYRNLPLPHLKVGDVLAVMDAGAYFTSTATNFGGPRPAVVLLDKDRAELIRRRETHEDLVRQDVGLGDCATQTSRADDPGPGPEAEGAGR